MSELVAILANIKTPLILGGLVIILFYSILKILIKSEKLGRVGTSQTFKIITLVINKFFVLALVAIILGFFGYTLPYVTTNKKTHDGIVVHMYGKVVDDEGKPLRKVMITIDGTRFKAISTADGKYADSFRMKELNDFVVVRAHHDGYYTFETTESISSKDHYLNIRLNKK
jgi:hypothetical protein